MKKIVLLFSLIISCYFCNAQQVQPSQPREFDASYYLKKSKNQKTAAWFLLGGGAVAATAGLVIAMNHMYIWTWDDNYDDGEPEASILFFGGSAAMLGSIPLFIAGARNKGRAMHASAGFKMEQLKNGQLLGSRHNSYPAIGFKISLR